MSKENSQFFAGLKEDLQAYIDTQLQLAKLTIYEKSARAVALLALGLALFFTLLFALLFIFLSLGFFLSDLFGSTTIGFTAIALVYILLFAGLLLLRKRISGKIEDVVIKELTRDDEYDDEGSAVK